MSLQLAAHHLASKGRGPDTTLVHMAPREVAGLQALARAHGGSLTVNPETGLPEAGFLSSILPMIAGVALGPAGLGLTAMQAAMATGAVSALATGDLRKGLMAGLGAYGGAGIGGSISSLGSVVGDAVSPTVGAVAAPVAPVAPVAPPAEVSAVTTSPVVSSNVQGTPVVPNEYAGFAPTSTQYGAFGEPIVTTTPQPEPVVAAAPAPAPEVVDSNVNAKDRLLQRGAVESPAFVPSKSPFENFKSGLGAVVDDPSKLMTKDNLKYGLAALAPVMFQEQKRPSYQGSGPNPYQYAYNPGRLATPTRSGDQGQYAYFNPSYTRMAEGGPVGAMSEQNAQETLLANGGQRFADGGSTNPYSYAYDPVTKTYRDPTTAITPVRTVTQMPGVGGGYAGEPGPSAPDPNNNWGELTPLEQAQYYSMHPTMAAITQFGQNLFGYTTPGMIQNALVPGFVAEQKSIPSGQMLAQYMQQYDPFGNLLAPNAQAAMSTQDQANINAQGSYAEGQVDTGPMGGNGADNEDAGMGQAIADAALSDAVVASDASSGVGGDAVSDGGGDGGGSGDGGGDGEKRGGIIRRRTGGLSAIAPNRYNLGDYSDGGRLLRGPGDGVSDSIPAVIGNKRPARLADGEFVIPARIVSELGNGSTNAGAKKLYAMMDRIQKGRSKSIGKGRVAVNSRSEKLLPA